MADSSSPPPPPKRANDFAERKLAAMERAIAAKAHQVDRQRFLRGMQNDMHAMVAALQQKKGNTEDHKQEDADINESSDATVKPPKKEDDVD